MNPKMLDEALAAPDAVARQTALLDAPLRNVAQHLRELQPRLLGTVARGSSDHAASYLAYLVMQTLGVPVASLPMSVMTLHQAPLRVQGQVAIALSQSGQSPDLVDSMAALRRLGAYTLALVNAEASPLEHACEAVLPLHAGTEYSVAATKSFIASLSVAACLVAHWREDSELLNACQALPEQLRHAAAQDWAVAVERLSGCQRLMVIGRGLGFSIAQEAALKFKETSVIQAEAFSGAEVRHGPMALVGESYPLLIFATRGPEQTGLLSLAADLRQRGADVLLAAPDDVAGRDLTLCRAAHPALDPLLAIQSFYPMVAALAVARGLNPDQPRHLNKVTRTH